MNEHRTNHVAPRLLVAVTLAALLALPAVAGAEQGAQVPVSTFKLDNGMEFLAVQRPELSTVYAAWVAHVGSSNERPGITGISHFFEHMMFKGTHTIGTTNITRDLEIMDELEKIQEQIRAARKQQQGGGRGGVGGGGGLSGGGGRRR